jgi:hypothetical protein
MPTVAVLDVATSMEEKLASFMKVVGTVADTLTVMSWLAKLTLTAVGVPIALAG